MRTLLLLLFVGLLCGFGTAIKTLSSPFDYCGSDPSQNGICKVLNPDAYASLASLAVGERVTINDFRLQTEGRKGILSLTRFSAAEDQSDLPYVVLLRGSFRYEDEDEVHVEEEDYLFDLRQGSTVFLALSHYGSNGWIEVGGNYTYVLSTPRLSPDRDDPIMDMYVKQLYVSSSKVRKVAGAHTSVLAEKSFLSQSIFEYPMNDYILPPEGSNQPLLINPINNNNTSDEVSINLKKTFRVATDLDFQLFRLLGSNVNNANNYYHTLVGSTSTIYRRDFGHDLVSSYLNVYQFQDSYPGTTGTCLNYMQQTWNPTAPSRSVAALLSGKKLGGGVAYLRTLCNLYYAYAVNGNMVGYFPTPVRDHDGNNWDIYVFSHEVGHVWGAQHTHELNPPADNCGNTPGCAATTGTIMSYCHLCSGGMTNIVMRFHPRSITQVKAYVDNLNC